LYSSYFIGIAIVEAGCVLEKLEIALDKYNLTLPLDLGAKGRYMLDRLEYKILNLI